MSSLRMASLKLLTLPAAIALFTALATPARADVQITFESPTEVYPYSVSQYGDRVEHTTVVRVPIVRDRWDRPIPTVIPFGHPRLGHGNFGHGNFRHGTFGHGNFGRGNFGHGNFGHGNFGRGNFGHGNFGHGNFGHGNFGHSPFGNSHDRFDRFDSSNRFDRFPSHPRSHWRHGSPRGGVNLQINLPFGNSHRH
jgi:PPE-repeat protein